ncbi:hypothetical protein HK101_001849 [Irineochytrium annulatum]|nr:hypothetical protein HK101_001849 [Irineochytrium annulatum]
MTRGLWEVVDGKQKLFDFFTNFDPHGDRIGRPLYQLDRVFKALCLTIVGKSGVERCSSKAHIKSLNVVRHKVLEEFVHNHGLPAFKAKYAQYMGEDEDNDDGTKGELVLRFDDRVVYMRVTFPGEAVEYQGYVDGIVIRKVFLLRPVTMDIQTPFYFADGGDLVLL